ncbi:hypothetical protein Unana1_03773 [Umbelopsis nana]
MLMKAQGFLVLYFADGNQLFWPELAKKWPKLKHVSVHSNGHFLGGKDPSQGIEHILSNLHSLNLLRCRGFLASIRLSPPSASVLRSLKVQIGHVSEYHNLKNLVTSCRNTLETLAISWKAVDIGLPQPDISELILKSPKLKSFGLEWKANSAFLISTFGNKLSDLELQGRDSHSSMDIDKAIGNALSRISNLKRLSMKSCLSIAGFITLALEANSTTLEEFQFCDRDANHLLANLTMTNALLCNVTTLYVNAKRLDMQCFRRLPSVFPGIKYLEMVLPAKMQPKRSELLLVLSKLECLKGVSLKTRFLDVPSANETDPLKKYSIPYMGCDVQKPLILF